MSVHLSPPHCGINYTWGGKICLSYVQNLLHLVVHFPFEAQHCSRLGHLHLSGGHWHDVDDPSHPLQVHGQQFPWQLVPH